MNLLDLPAELLTEEILSQLPVSSLVSCLLTCKQFFFAIKSSVRLQYHYTLKQAAMLDNPSCSLDEYPYHRRLELLQEREDRWKSLQYDWRSSVSVPPTISGYYTASSEYYALGQSHRAESHVHANKGVYVARMPSSAQESLDWKLYDESKVIIDFTTSIDQQDLLACIVAVPGAPNHYTTLIHLVQHSTGQDHPEAQEPLLFLGDSIPQDTRPYVSFEISGNHVALIITNVEAGRSQFRLYAWNWRTGKLKGTLTLPTRDLTFLREDLILYASAGVHGNFQAILIPPNDDPDPELRIICKLQLPELSRRYRYSSEGLRSDPAPFRGPRLHSSSFSTPPLHTSSPFFSNPDEAIVTMFLLIVSTHIHDSLALVVHRASLLAIIEDAIESAAAQADEEVPIEVTDAPTDAPHQPDDDVQAPADDQDPDLPPASPEPPPPIEPPCVHWSAWGPDNTRLLRTKAHLNPFLITSLGTRWARLASSEDPLVEWPFPEGSNNDHMLVAPLRRIEVLDFNRSLIRILDSIYPYDPKDEENIANIELSEGPELNPRGSALIRRSTVFGTQYGIFKDVVETKLPFVINTVVPHPDDPEADIEVPSDEAKTASDVFSWGAIAITQENIIGIENNDDDVWVMDELQLLHFG